MRKGDETAAWSNLNTYFKGALQCVVLFPPDMKGARWQGAREGGNRSDRERRKAFVTAAAIVGAAAATPRSFGLDRFVGG